MASDIKKESLVLATALSFLMLLSSAMAHYSRPTKFFADTRPRSSIAELIPTAFADWHAIDAPNGIISPDVAALVNKIYTETLNRTYTNSRGDRVMLSVAYGRNQSDDFQVHRPEICYPAQGFEVTSNIAGTIETSFGSIHVRKLETALGEQRVEPVTYWTTLGNEVTIGRADKKVKEIRYALKGYIADGMLFRISSINRESSAAFELHRDFANALLTALSPAGRNRIAGLKA